MIRIVIERIPKLKDSIQNHFFIKADYVKKRDPYCGYGDCIFFVLEFYLNPSPKSARPIRYLKFRTYGNIDEFPKIEDLKIEDSEGEHLLISNNFTINDFFKILRGLIFKDKILSNRICFLKKNDFLKFCVKLLEYIDEETTNDMEKAKKFILSHKFLYLLS